MLYTPEGIVAITTQKKKYSAMVNPINEEFQTHIFERFERFGQKYQVWTG